MKPDTISAQWAQLRRRITRFTWGGAWAVSLSDHQRRNLTLFFYDGLFSAASDKIILTYLTIYLLTLGVTRAQIGLLSSFSNLADALLLLPAAMLVERTGKRKEITVKSALVSRTVVLLMALLPFLLLDSPALVWIILALALIRDGANNFAFPGWIALTSDIVPLEGRGRYFGARNFIMGLAGMIVTLIIGEAITQIGDPLGYQLAYLLAAILGGISIHFFSKIIDSSSKNESIGEAEEAEHHLVDDIKGIFTSLKGHPHFIKFAIYIAVWNFGINIAAPFFSVYMVDTLHLTAAMIGVVTVLNTAANMLVQRQVGVLADKWGNRIVTIVFLALIPVLPVLWGLWVQQYWHVILLQVLGGLLWGGFNLVSFNNLLMQTPEDQRARFSAFYQIIVTLSLAGGAALGSYLITRFDFIGVTLASAALRWVAAMLFVLIVANPADTIDNPPVGNTGI